MPVLTSGQQERKSKQRKIRNSEYYDMEGTFDRLYAESKKDKTFNHLMEIIESEENIKLAYRTIKKNTGSDTSGVDKRTIADLAKLSEEEYVRLIRKQFSNYHPRPVRRVEIPKPNGKSRPLGIPTIVDRIVQQCILQVMEPICEAKFSENSNGFRPNRSAETAIAQCMRLIQVQHLYHVVDLDIKGFFDNISHTKLIRQIWALGIRDKKLLCIIKEMLKAPVVLPDGKKTYPARGTPQGGILSPLLANIVLNELDWWIASQWEEMPTKTKFKTRSNAQGTEIKSHAYRALRRSRLKEMHAVRYADDFKIFCATHEDAVRAYKATELWLKDRLGLEISPDKSKVVNLKRQNSDFLGFKLKVRKKGKKYVVRSHMSDKAYKKAHEKVSEEVKKLAHSSDDNAQFMQLQKYNSVVAGLHEYYIRKFSDVPVIVVSAKSLTFNKVELLRLGADDYLTKPFDLDELLARIERNLLRSQKDTPNLCLTFGELSINTSSKIVTVADEIIVLTAKEYQLVELLAKYPDKVFSKQNLYESIWQEPFARDNDVINTHISNLRKKLKGEGCRIKTIWGLGYRFAK
jgi:RNA-directed DNA polymerase